jgi:hypothetical protein
MNEIFICTGFVIVVIGIMFYFIIRSMWETRRIIIAKQDAIMQKLIDIKHR